MKKFMVPMIATLVLVTSIAQADLSYKWVPMTESQKAAFVDKCFYAKAADYGNIALGAVAGTALAAGTVISAKALSAGTQSGISVTGVVVAPIFGAAVYAGAISVMLDSMTLNELKTMVYEQQTGQAGLMTAKLEAFADENQFDVNRLMASLNISALHNELCLSSNERMHREGFKYLAADQINEKETTRQANLKAAQDKKLAEEKQQEELIRRELAAQTQQVLDQVR